MLWAIPAQKHGVLSAARLAQTPWTASFVTCKTGITLSIHQADGPASLPLLRRCSAKGLCCAHSGLHGVALVT